MNWAEVVKINSDLKEPLNTKIAVLKLLLEQIKDFTGTADVDINSILTAVGGIKTDVAAVKTDVGNVKTDVGTVNTNVNSVKSTLGTVNTNVNTANTNINTANTNINSIKTTVGTVNTNVSSILTAVNSIKTAGTVPAIKSVQRGNVAYVSENFGYSSPTSKTITISSVNLSKSILLIIHFKSSQYLYTNSYHYLSSATAITYWPWYSHWVDGIGTVADYGGFSWQVVEFY